jgi:hypothetical protein
VRVYAKTLKLTQIVSFTLIQLKRNGCKHGKVYHFCPYEDSTMRGSKMHSKLKFCEFFFDKKIKEMAFHKAKQKKMKKTYSMKKYEKCNNIIVA